MGEPGGLLSKGTHRVGHDWSDLAAAAAVRFLLSFSIKICYYQGTIAHHVAKTNGQFSVLNSLDPSAAFSTAAHALFKNTSFVFRASRKSASWISSSSLVPLSLSLCWFLFICLASWHWSDTQSFELFSLYFLNELIQFCALNTLYMLMTSKAKFSV